MPFIKKNRQESVSRERVVFRRDNARPRTSLTRQKLSQLEWHVFLPKLAPSDFHSLLSPQNSLKGKIFDSDLMTIRNLKCLGRSFAAKYQEYEISPVRFLSFEAARRMTKK
ncbi:hypothetical protein WN51_04960 [Melipona quadrifasciata]|uniref:Histone-lysine N-methyltransferase SETMAR n=1 Tax=Melipona quadrifasciata TaxID=166423 RepID=A0A0N0U3E6_9HYME|nr:hypothetical protein WN51_04960 [Melipona quadrifasciata]